VPSCGDKKGLDPFGQGAEPGCSRDAYSNCPGLHIAGASGGQQPSLTTYFGHALLPASEKCPGSRRVPKGHFLRCGITRPIALPRRARLQKIKRNNLALREAAWLEADRIKTELAAASAAHAARSAELDSRVHLIEMRERELEKTLHDVAALKTEYESKLIAFEAILKGPVRRA
jgi:hypothetical protein